MNPDPAEGSYKSIRERERARYCEEGRERERERRIYGPQKLRNLTYSLPCFEKNSRTENTCKSFLSVLSVLSSIVESGPKSDMNTWIQIQNKIGSNRKLFFIHKYEKKINYSYFCSNFYKTNIWADPDF